jgi:polar amino acid transport system substrate-binding protein
MTLPPFSLRRISLLILSVTLVIFLVQTYRRSRPYNDGTWRRVQESGVLRIGMDASYPPFGVISANGPLGLDVDLINEIGRRLGVRVEIVNLGFDGMYEDLYTGKVDALISALSVDPAQLGRFFYTRPYIDAGQVIVSRDGTYQTMRDLDGHSVALEYGSIGDEVARIWKRRLRVLNLIHFTTADEALQAVASGKADAALVDSITARLYLRSHSGLILSKKTAYPDVYAIAVRTGSYDLAGVLNRLLNDMERDGTLSAIIERWLSQPPADAAQIF